MEIAELMGYSVTMGRAVVCSAVAAGIICAIACLVRREPVTLRTIVFAGVLNGVTFVPFLCMFMSPFYPRFKEAALAAEENVAIAGFIGLLYIARAILNPNKEEIARAARKAPVVQPVATSIDTAAQ